MVEEDGVLLMSLNVSTSHSTMSPLLPHPHPATLETSFSTRAAPLTGGGGRCVYYDCNVPGGPGSTLRHQSSVVRQTWWEQEHTDHWHWVILTSDNSVASSSTIVIRIKWRQCQEKVWQNQDPTFLQKVKKFKHFLALETTNTACSCSKDHNKNEQLTPVLTLSVGWLSQQFPS